MTFRTMAMRKEIDGLEALIYSNRNAFDDKIQDIAGRLNRAESAAVVVREVRQDSAMTVGTALSIVGGCVAVVSVLIGLYTGKTPPSSTVSFPTETVPVPTVKPR
jgi:hypothetical protein